MAQSQVVFFLTTLTSEQLRDEYEAWVRDVDTPLAVKLPGVSSYRVVRLEAPAMPDAAMPAAYNYIEIIEVDDFAMYQASISTTPDWFFEQFRTYIGDFAAVVGTVIN